MDDNPSTASPAAEDAPPEVPSAWKEGRAGNAEEWFAAQRDRCVRSFYDGKAQSAADAVASQAAEEADVAKRRRLDQHIEQLELVRLQLVSAKTRMRHTVDDATFAKVLSFPHFVSPRPLVVLCHVGSSSFVERLLCRGLVSSLLANAADREVEAASGGTDGRLLDVVWWDALQGQLAAAHKGLARLEALEFCRCVVVVLSRQYCAAPEYESERALLLNRLLHPLAYRAGPLQAVVAVRLIQCDADRLLDFPVPPPPEGAYQPLAVTYLDIDVSMAPPSRPEPAALLAAALDQLREPLSAAGVDLLPDAEVTWHPSQASGMSCGTATAAAAAASTLSSTATMAQSLFPATLSGGREQAWAASHRMPHPHQRKPLDSWSWGDVQMWMQSLGHSTSSHAPGLLRLGVDGWLLASATAADLATYCGVSSAATCKHLMEQLKALRDAPAVQDDAGSSIGGVSCTPGALAEIMSFSELELSQVFADVLLFYDVDATGDLNLAETAALLDATGLSLTSRSPVSADLAAEVLSAYDADGDGVLNRSETCRLLNDVICLLVARSDAGAWAAGGGGGGDDDGWQTAGSVGDQQTAEAGSSGAAMLTTSATGTSLPSDQQLRPELEHAVTSSDLQHQGLLDLPALRQALGHGALSRSLSPLHMWLLVRHDRLRATDARQLSRTAGGSLAVRGRYVADSVAVVAESRRQLHSVVYEPRGGTAALLAALYRQTAAATNKLDSADAVDVDAAMEVLSAYLGTLGGRPTALIQHAMLQEAVATAFEAEAQDPVVVWSQVVAHMMYALQQL